MSTGTVSLQHPAVPVRHRLNIDAMTASRGASWASRSSHMIRSIPSIASARVTTEARIASRSASLIA